MHANRARSEHRGQELSGIPDNHPVRLKKLEDVQPNAVCEAIIKEDVMMDLSGGIFGV